MGVARLPGNGYKKLGLIRENGKQEGLFLQSIRNLEVNSQIASGHYTNYAVIHGSMPRERDRMFSTIEDALQMQKKISDLCMWERSDEMVRFGTRGSTLRKGQFHVTLILSKN